MNGSLCMTTFFTLRILSTSISAVFSDSSSVTSSGSTNNLFPESASTKFRQKLGWSFKTLQPSSSGLKQVAMVTMFCDDKFSAEWIANEKPKPVSQPVIKIAFRTGDISG